MIITKLRKKIVKLGLEWERLVGVAPQLTSAISEYDAMKLVGMSEKDVFKNAKNKTSVQKGYDFIHNGIKYQVKANRPSYKKNSFVTITSKAKNYDFDKLIWILYNSEFVIQEAYEWNKRDYKRKFDELKHVRPIHLRYGKKLI